MLAIYNIKAVVTTSLVVEQRCVVYIICMLISIDVWEPWLTSDRQSLHEFRNVIIICHHSAVLLYLIDGVV